MTLPLRKSLPQRPTPPLPPLRPRTHDTHELVGTARHCHICEVRMAAPLRCLGCRKLLAELVVSQWRIKCPRCGVYALESGSL